MFSERLIYVPNHVASFWVLDVLKVFLAPPVNDLNEIHPLLSDVPKTVPNFEFDKRFLFLTLFSFASQHRVETDQCKEANMVHS
jgi:hypothetical protein